MEQARSFEPTRELNEQRFDVTYKKVRRATRWRDRFAGEAWVTHGADMELGLGRLSVAGGLAKAVYAHHADYGSEIVSMLPTGIYPFDYRCTVKGPDEGYFHPIEELAQQELAQRYADLLAMVEESFAS